MGKNGKCGVVILIFLLMVTGCSGMRKKVDTNFFEEMNEMGTSTALYSGRGGVVKESSASRFYFASREKEAGTSTVMVSSGGDEMKYKIELVSDSISLNDFILVMLSETGLSFVTLEKAPMIYCNVSGEYTRGEIVEMLRRICLGLGFRVITSGPDGAMMLIESESEGKLSNYGVFVYKCRYIRPSQAVLDMLKTRKDILLEVQGNYVLCMASELDLKVLVDLVKMMDVDVFKGYYVSFVVCQDAKKQVEKLNSVLSSMYARYQESIQLMVVSNNVFCVVSSVMDYVGTVESLSRMMTNYVAPEKNLYVIPVRYRLSSEALTFIQTVAQEIKVSNDVELNSIIVNGSKSDYDVVVKLLSEYDKQPRQVLVRLYLIDVKSNDSLNAGTDWLLESGKFGLEQTQLIYPLSEGFNMFYQVGNVKAFFSFLESKFDAQIISRPYIYLKSGQSAKIKVGSEVPFIASKTSQTNISSGIVQNVSYREVGIIFKITASVADNEDVIFDVYIESSDLKHKAGVENNPVFISDSLESKFVMRNKTLCVLGGIKSRNSEKTRNGIPFLSRIPVLGYVFGSVSRIDENREMLIGIYPNVIGSEEAARVGGKILNRLDLMEGLKNGEANRN